MRIFVLGDSFADNLFAEGYDHIINHDVNSPYPLSPIANYMLSLQKENIEDAKWWTDWLEEWGYEVINFGLGGCSNQNIFYQFAKIDKEFKEGDRIILHWSDHCRFDWIVYDDGRNMSIHPNINQSHFDFIEKGTKDILNNHSVRIDNSFKGKDGYLNINLIPFMDWIVEKHSEYNPIVWSAFSNTLKYVNESRRIWHDHPSLKNELDDNWTMYKESNGMVNDGHYGRYGNYYMAVLFDEMIKSGITINFSDTENQSIIFNNTIQRIKNENLIFKNPQNWPEGVKKIKKENERYNSFSKWITQKHEKWLKNN
jgi:hypothetical protein